MRKMETAQLQTGESLVSRIEQVPLSRFHLKVASILGVGTFLDAYDGLVMASALTVVFSALHIGFVNGGLLLGAAYVGQFAGAVAVGAMSEYFGRRRTFILSIVLFGVLAGASAVSWDFTSLLWLRITQGIGLGAEIPMAAALFNELIPSRSRGWIYLNYQNIFGWGVMLTPLIGVGVFAVTPPQIGWRVLLAIGMLPLLLAIVAWRVLPESPRWLVNKGRLNEAERIVAAMESQASRGQQAEASTAATTLPGADREPTRFTELFSKQYLSRTVLLWIMFAVSYFVVYAFIVWLPTLYVKLGGLPPGRALLLSAINGIAFVGSGYALAFIIDRVGRRPAFMFCFAVTATGALIGVLATMVFHLTGWPVLFAVTVVLAVGIYPVNIGCFLYAPELFPTRMRGWATGTGSGIQRLAIAVAPIVVGWILQNSPDRPTGVGTIFGLLCGMALVGLIAMAVLGVETRNRTLEETSSVPHKSR
jgi:MFS transporter, putative metabolite:H+ symporter